MPNFDPHFRKFTGGEILMPIRDNNIAPLILVMSSGEMRFASSANKKDELMSLYNESEGDIMLYVWAGRSRADVFQLTPEDLQKHFTN